MNKSKTAVQVPQNRKSLKSRIMARWQLYLLLLVPAAFVLIFNYGPMAGLVIAFENYTVRGGIFGSDWVGFDNFIEFFTSYRFPIILKNTLTVSLYSLIVTFPIPIIFALLLNCLHGEKYKKVVHPG